MPALRRLSRLAFVFLTVLLAISLTPSLRAAGPAAGELPAGELIVAVDTSRSLSPAALAATLAGVGDILAALPPETRVGLLAFDDHPRWEVEPGSTPAAARAGLGRLRPQGSYTLLHDALFEATRRLGQGGAILLVTDGRDENSATTVEDIARRCEAQKVRIVAAGSGVRVEEKALRRLALLSRGEYLGKSPKPAAAAAALTENLRQSAADLEAEKARLAASLPRPAAPLAAPGGPGALAGGAPSADGGQPGAPAQSIADARPAAPAAAQMAQRGAQPAARPAEKGLFDYLPWIALGLLLIVLLLSALQRRAAAGRSAAAELEAQRQDEESQVADEADAAAIRLELAQVAAAQPRESPEVTVDTGVLQRMSLDQRLERTSVLSSMLILRQPGEAPRSFMLDRDKAFAVGRDREKNTLGVPDPALSAQHFRIVPRAGVYYFVDLESTNGSYIGSRKVRAKRLRSGDLIRAGQVEFEYQSYGDAP